MCANIWSLAAVEIQRAPWMRTYTQLQLVFRFVLICGAQRPEGFISGLQYVRVGFYDNSWQSRYYLFKSLHILSNTERWWWRQPVTKNGKMQSINPFISEYWNISRYTFYNLNRATLLSCDLGAEAEAVAATAEEDSLVYSNITQMESVYFPRSCNDSASDK